MRSACRLLACGLAALLVGCADPGALAVTRVDVRLDVRPDGSVDVREEIEVRLHPGQGTFVRRVRSRADDLVFVSASIDGAALELGQPGNDRVDADAGRRELAVTWSFPAAPGPSTRHFSLAYRAVGAVAVQGSRGLLRHLALAGERAYPIDLAHLELALPAGAAVFQGTGIAEAGWTVSRTDAGIAAERHNLDPADSATVVAEFSIDRAAIHEADWQRRDEWAGYLVPAFLSGGLFVLVVGGGILWILRFRYPRRLRPAAEDDSAGERQNVRAGLRTSGFAVMLLAIGLGLVVQLALSDLGIAAFALPASLLIVGIVFVLVSRRWV